jgi:hypothetical protein
LCIIRNVVSILPQVCRAFSYLASEDHIEAIFWNNATTPAEILMTASGITTVSKELKLHDLFGKSSVPL